MRNAIFLVTALIVGCDSSETVVCDANLTVAIPDGEFTTHVCIEYEDLDDDDAQQAKDSCSAPPFNGKLVDSCPTDRQLGLCSLKARETTVNEHFYSDNGVTSDIAKQGCEGAKGTWTPE
jgi:hypothetical protein